MCLEMIHKETKKWRTGYKLFLKENQYLQPAYSVGRCYIKDGIGRKSYPVGQWLKDKNDSILKNPFKGRYYEPGFHFFKEKPKAHYGTVVKKIRIRKMTATGKQFGRLAGAAKEIYIEP